MRTKLGWFVILGVIGAGGLALGWQRDVQVRLRRDLGHVRAENQELMRLREANRQLAAAQPSSTELENLRADHAAIPQLGTEIDALRERVRLAAEKPAAPLPERFATGSNVTADGWKNAGTATPRAALETMLWAAAGGDIDTFASCLFLGGGKLRQQADALLESLPADQRARYGTPDRLLASLAIRDVPLSTAHVIDWGETGGAKLNAFVHLQLSTPEGTPKDVNLWFTNQGAGWKLTVPDAAIAKYSAMLKDPAVAPDDNK